jgi:Domain of unknown function (DUF4279)
MDTNTNNISVVFRIAGSANDIAALAPALALLQGQVVLKPSSVPSRALPEAWWAIEVTQCNQESTEIVIIETLDRVEPIQTVILKIANDLRFQIELDCTIEINENRPEIEVSPLTLKRIARMNAALSFEVYDNRE